MFADNDCTLTDKWFRVLCYPWYLNYKSRKHTGERPFPCHCGKAFSRLDNLRQHAATVHAEQAQLNETMLASLAPIHAALSQRASREQRRRGEVVEVPKGAVERRRETRKAQAAQAAAAAHREYNQ